MTLGYAIQTIIVYPSFHIENMPKAKKKCAKPLSGEQSPEVKPPSFVTQRSGLINMLKN